MILASTNRPGPHRVRAIWNMLAMFALLGMELAPTSKAEPEKTGSKGAIAASIETEPSEIKLGQPVSVTIKIKGIPPKVRYSLPASLDLDPFVELSRGKNDKASGSTQVLHLTVTCFDKLGKLTLPAIDLVSKTDKDAGEQKTEKLTIPAVSIEVKSILEGVRGKPTPKDIAKPVAVFVSDYRPLVALGLAILWLVAGFMLLRKKKTQEVPTRLEQLPPPRQAHEIALEKLEQIVSEDLPRQGKFRDYFARVSKTIREYIGNRYSFFALDLTSSELIEELRDRITPGLDIEKLTKLLEEADLVKFAKMKPTDSMISYAVDTAYEIVQSTRVQQTEQQESKP